MSEGSRRRLDAGFSLLIRVASLLVLLAVAGVVLQMVMVARPLFLSTGLAPDSNAASASRQDRPDWVPETLVRWQAEERFNQRIWVGFDPYLGLMGELRWRNSQARSLSSSAWFYESLPLPDYLADSGMPWFALEPGWQWLMTSDGRGGADLWSLVTPGQPPIRIDMAPFTGMTRLPGGRSIVTWRDNVLTQWHWLRKSGTTHPSMVMLRQRQFSAPIVEVAAAEGLQRVAITTTAPALHVWHTTSDRLLGSLPLSTLADSLGWTPAGQVELGLGERVERYRLGEEAGAVSLRTLFTKTNYEGYVDAQHRWLPVTAADSEPKFGLLPLIWGTLKAALIAGLVAAPLGVGAAIFVGFFMSPGVRDRIKPLLELLAAIPSVVIGAMTALVIAPHFLTWLPGIIGALVAIPTGIVCVSLLWRLSASHSADRRGIEWLPLALVPLVLLLGVAGFWVGAELAQQLPGDTLDAWLEEEAGIGVVHRNALLVGLAMGIAVVPVVFSLAEDAIHAVPPMLAAGSLALGSTHWQSYRDVALPVAAPGVIAACMIGFGRAIGETMIVLLVAANTPLMDINLLEGIRTVSATLALELTEAPFESVHYRVLFAAGLALFTLTFLLNSLAEVVRLRAGRRWIQQL